MGREVGTRMKDLEKSGEVEGEGEDISGIGGKRDCIEERGKIVVLEMRTER